MAYGSLLTDVVQSSTAGTPPQFNDGNGTQTGTLCRAWVNFNGTTSPGTIRAQFNVSSVTKNATGDYTVNFTNAFSDANYAAVGLSRRGNTDNNSQVYLPLSGTYSTTACQVFTGATATSTTGLDSDIVNLAVFR